MTGPDESPLTGEDAKLVVLARAARLRAYVRGTTAAEGAAVRDTDGRTYSGATVAPTDPRLVTGALRAAIVAAASSGARTFEAAVLVTESGEVDADGLAVLGEFGSGVPLFVVDPGGATVGTHHT